MAELPPERAAELGIAPPDRRWYMGVKDPVYLTATCSQCGNKRAFGERDMVAAQREGPGEVRCLQCDNCDFLLSWEPLSALMHEPDDDDDEHVKKKR